MIMLCSLAVSDLLVGFVAQSLYTADELQSLTTQDVLFYRLSGMIGFLYRAAISADRFLAAH